MRTIRTKVYKFDELSEQAKQVAIEEMRNEYYQDNGFAMVGFQSTNVQPTTKL